MAEELIHFDLPRERQNIIKVIGVGGGGSNAVNHMFRQGITDVDFYVCNTDAQAMINSPVPNKIQLGETLTQGRGAGNKPEQGRQAAIESLPLFEEIFTSHTKMVFITAGMGGGTGTGAAPVIAKEAKEKGILTVAIVTLPFRFEGQRRLAQAIDGINQLKENVDSLLIINNEKLREIYGDLPVRSAFANADNVLTTAAKGIAEIITVHGIVNVDFADVHTVMNNSGVSIMGSGIASGDGRALKAIQNALISPLLNNNNILGAKNILLNLTSGSDELTMDEVGIITDFVQEAAGRNADIIWGNGTDLSLEDKISVTIIATGFAAADIPELMLSNQPPRKVVSLSDETPSSRTITVPGPASRMEFFKREVINPNQKTLFDDQEFTIRKEVERFELKDDFQPEPKVKPEVTQSGKTDADMKRVAQQRLKDLSMLKTENIENLENVPAYERAKIQFEDPAVISPDEVSRFTLRDDGNNGLKISADNPYLFDNVD